MRDGVRTIGLQGADRLLLDVHDRQCLSHLAAAVYKHNALGRLHPSRPNLPPRTHRCNGLPCAGIEQLNAVVAVRQMRRGRGKR